MNRIILPGCLALIVFLVAAFALTPAGLLHRYALQPHGITAERVTGTVMDGRWQGVHWQGRRLGSGAAGLAPLSLLTGQPRLRFSLAGEGIDLGGDFQLSGQTVRLTIGEGRIAPGRFIAASGESAALLNTPVRLRDIDGVFDSTGCVSLSGALSGDPLGALGARAGLELPVLSGELACAGQAAGFGFAGSNSQLTLDGHVRLDGFRAGWRIEVQTGDDTLAPALSGLGFSRSGDAWTAEGQSGLRP